MKNQEVLLFLQFCLFCSMTNAVLNVPLKEVKDWMLLENNLEYAIRVKTASIVIADYDFVRSRFPITLNFTNAQIDRWLLKNFGYIATGQLLAGPEINSPISHDDNDYEGGIYRPTTYRRAFLFQKNFDTEEYFVESKGSGAKKPLKYHHGDGLLPLGEAVREFMFEKLVSMILDAEGSSFKTVSNYAVIDWGFHVNKSEQKWFVWEDYQSTPAGAMLREPALRVPDPLAPKGSLFPIPMQLEVEKLLRKYGVTTTGAYHHMEGYFALNVQGTSKYKGLVDFGGYMMETGFPKPTIAFQAIQELDRKKKTYKPPILIPANDTSIDPNKMLDFVEWGYDVGSADATGDRVIRAIMKRIHLCDKLDSDKQFCQNDLRDYVWTTLDRAMKRIYQLP